MESWFECMLCYYARPTDGGCGVADVTTERLNLSSFSRSLLLATHPSPTHVGRILLYPFPHSPINRYTRLLSHCAK
jgi:hypothetical protein